MYGDTAIGIISSLGMAMGIFLVSLAGSFNLDLFGYLFGNVLAIDREEVILALLLALAVLVAMGLFYQEFVFLTFDPESAKASGVQVGRLDSLLAILTAVDRGHGHEGGRNPAHLRPAGDPGRRRPAGRPALPGSVDPLRPSGRGLRRERADSLFLLRLAPLGHDRSDLRGSLSSLVSRAASAAGRPAKQRRPRGGPRLHRPVPEGFGQKRKRRKTMEPKNIALTGDQCDIEIEFIEGYRSQLPGVVEAIIESCKEQRTIAHYDTAMIPSKQSVIEVLEDINDLLFPGYFHKQEMDTYSLSYHVGNDVSGVFDKLASQIARSIRHECRRLDSLCTRCLERGQKEALEFLRKIPALRQTLTGDVQAAYDGDPAAKNLDEIIFSYPGVLAVAVYRVAHELHVQGVPLLPRIMTEYAHSVTGIDIHPGAAIGKNFFIDHGTGVVIGETTEIGDRVKMYQGVTLGRAEFPQGQRGKPHPGQENGIPRSRTT